MSGLKCYLGGTRDPGAEFDFAAACFAKDQKEARRLLWAHGDLREHCEHEYFMLRVIRKPEYDENCSEATEGYLVSDDATLRQMGWACEGDSSCATCGLHEFDGKWPVCPDCYQCCECGCDCDPPARKSDG